MKDRLYMGVFYWGKRGEWYCDLIPNDPFKKLEEVKFYIKDWRECEGEIKDNN